MARLPGFAKLSPTERIEALLREGLLSWDEAQILKEQKGLPISIADQLTENVLSTFDLPFSLAPYFLINGRDYLLPMVTEEPSVVAAASFAAKLIQRSGGFTTQVHQRQMIGEIALSDVEDVEVASKRILEDKETLLQLANEAYPSIVKRGGGARDLWLEHKGDFLIVYLAVDPKEAICGYAGSYGSQYAQHHAGSSNGSNPKTLWCSGLNGDFIQLGHALFGEFTVCYRF